MAVFKVSQADCDRILALTKVIDQDIHWTAKTNEAWAQANLLIKSNDPGRLELIITINIMIPAIYSMTILYNQAHVIKRLDVNGSHLNKCSDGTRWNHQTHKHTWSEVCPDAHAYTPDDITGTTVEEVLKQFCQECNITFKGKFTPVPIRQRMAGL